jgi:hypothetical protein
MKNKCLVFIPLILALFGAGCKKANVNLNPALPQVPFRPSQTADQNKKKTPTRYEYPGFRFREPFIPLTGSDFTMRSANEIVVPNIESLKLKGIIGDKKSRMALLAGGGISYILQDSKLYDNRRRVVPGISGVIKRGSVLLIDSASKTIELKFHDTN